MKRGILALLLTLSAAAPVWAANDDYTDDAAVNENDNAVDVEQNVVCGDSIIQVEELTITCDSPGAYYYGSGKYRNSPTCKPGDKAKIVLDFFIDDDATIEYAGNEVYFTMIVDGSYSQIKTVYENAALCGIGSVNSLSGNGCPARGYYQIKEKFYWDKSDNSNNSTSFYPTVTVGFRSNANQYTFDYGGANTDLCRGSTFVTWSKRVKKTYANALSNFIKTFGILCMTIAMMGAFIWVLVHKPKNFVEAKAKLVPNKDYEQENAVFDFRKLPSGANKPNVQLVDF